MTAESSLRVRETVLTADRSAREVYSVVVFDDGAWGVARNGRPIAGNYWPARDSDECIATFMRMAGLAADDGQGAVRAP